MRRQQQSRSPLSKLVIFVAALAALYGGYYWGNQYQSKKPAYSVIRLLEPPRPMQSVDLVDQFGEPFSEQRLRNRWSLIVFGYSRDRSQTRDILTLCTRVLNRLADNRELQQATQVVFVTVDPERDTPVVLRELVGYFSQDFLGISGSVEQIGAFARQVGTRFQRQEDDSGNDYRVDHSTSIALTDPEARLVGLFTGLVDAANIASDLKLIAEQLSNDESP